MADELIDIPVSNPGARGAQNHAAIVDIDEGNGRSARAIAPTTQPEHIGARAEHIPDGGRVLPESVKEKITALIAAKRVGATVDVEDDPDAPPGEVEEVPVAEAAAGPATKADPAKPGAAIVAGDPIAELRAKIAGYEAHNRKLVDELEAVKKAPKADTSPTRKLLAEADADYIENTDGALRKFIASALGLEDPASPEVDAEIRDLYTDLTAKVLAVTPDGAHQAKREAARSKRLWDRERRQRKAEEQAHAGKTEQDAQSKAADAAADFIGNRFSTKRDAYPLTVALSETLDGMTPERLLWQVIQRETKTGRLDGTKPDDQLIADAAKIVEDHYASIAERVSKAKPATTTPSTAQPSVVKTPDVGASARPAERQGHGARTLTNTDASVAPATPPAKPTPKKNERPVFKSDEEARHWATRHLRKKQK